MTKYRAAVLGGICLTTPADSVLPDNMLLSKAREELLFYGLNEREASFADVKIVKWDVKDNNLVYRDPYRIQNEI